MHDATQTCTHLRNAVMALAFTLPKGYELRKDDCDRALAAAGSKAKELYGKLDEAVFKSESWVRLGRGSSGARGRRVSLRARAWGHGEGGLWEHPGSAGVCGAVLDCMSRHG